MEVENNNSSNLTKEEIELLMLTKDRVEEEIKKIGLDDIDLMWYKGEDDIDAKLLFKCKEDCREEVEKTIEKVLEGEFEYQYDEKNTIIEGEEVLEANWVIEETSYTRYESTTNWESDKHEIVYYKPSCPYGYTDCINDTARRKAEYPSRFLDGLVESCRCKDGEDYDDEDK